MHGKVLAHIIMPAMAKDEQVARLCGRLLEAIRDANVDTEIAALALADAVAMIAAMHDRYMQRVPLAERMEVFTQRVGQTMARLPQR